MPFDSVRSSTLTNNALISFGTTFGWTVKNAGTNGHIFRYTHVCVYVFEMQKIVPVKRYSKQTTCNMSSTNKETKLKAVKWGESVSRFIPVPNFHVHPQNVWNMILPLHPHACELIPVAAFAAFSHRCVFASPSTEQHHSTHTPSAIGGLVVCGENKRTNLKV